MVDGGAKMIQRNYYCLFKFSSIQNGGKLLNLRIAENNEMIYIFIFIFYFCC